MAVEEPGAEDRVIPRAPAFGWWATGLFLVCALGILLVAWNLENTAPTVERSAERLQSLRAAASQTAAQCAGWEGRMGAESLSDQAALFCACSRFADTALEGCAARLLEPHQALIAGLTAPDGVDPALAARAVRCEDAHGADLPARLSCIAEAQ